MTPADIVSMEDQIFTTYEISRALSVDITTVMSWIDQGKLSAYKTPGGHRRVPKSDLLHFLKKYKMPIPLGLKHDEKRALIVDDDEQIIRLILRVLKKWDPKLKVETAKDGFEAGQKLESFSPHLVVLDLMLPGINGFRICKNIRSNKKTKEIKILAISGENTEETRKNFLNYGADGFLAKPFSIETFNHTINKLLSPV